MVGQRSHECWSWNLTITLLGQLFGLYKLQRDCTHDKRHLYEQIGAHGHDFYYDGEYWRINKDK